MGQVTTNASFTMVAKDQLPQAGTLNRQDMKEWLIQSAIYSVVIPVLLVFLTSLQGGIDIKTASVAAYYALISASVNLLIKYSHGV